MSKSKQQPKKDPLNKDKARMRQKIDTMINNGRSEITTKKQLEKYPIGSLVSYMNTGGIFRIGGYIKRFDDEYFVYSTIDFSKNIRVKYKFVSKIWAGDVYKCKNDIVSIIPSTNKKTKHSVKLGNVVVYYARDNSVLGHYTHTEKYQRMVKWYETFGSDN